MTKFLRSVRRRSDDVRLRPRKCELNINLKLAKAIGLMSAAVSNSSPTR